MAAPTRAPHVTFESATALWDWLALNHSQSNSVWAVTYKKHVRGKYLSRDDMLDALIAYGWIDGRRAKICDDTTKQLIAPRKQQTWAQTYKTRAAALESAGKMQAPGRAAIAQAKAAGLWDASKDVDALVVPPDLTAALGSGAAWFSSAAPSYRRNVLRWIAAAKRSDTRAKRINTVADHAKAGRKVPQY